MNATPTVKKWKMLLLNWLFIYPLINLIIPVVFPLTDGWPMPARTLVLTALLVPIMGFALPMLHRRFAAWLTR
jgi:antibiotic biosynthesis monooxygenase (ABM) superfamily enzyme